MLSTLRDTNENFAREQASAHQRREYYRVRYPIGMQPEIKIGDSFLKITEISEKGLRLNGTRHEVGPINSALQGEITFKNGSVLTFAGTVFSFYGKEATILFTVPINHSTILAQQVDIQIRTVS